MTYSVFHLVGYIPDIIDLLKIIVTGLARKGRNSFTKVVGKSWGTEEAAWNHVKPNTLVEVRLSCGCVGVLTISLWRRKNDFGRVNPGGW